MILGIMSSIKETAAYGVFGLLLFIDGCVYWFVSKLFSLYTTLASATIIDATVYEKLSSRVYLFIGVIALFIVTISLLKAMVNPDELNKGTKKIATNFATSLAMVIMVPTVFAFLMDFQAAIFYENIIGKVFVNVGKPEASNKTIRSVRNITSDDDLNISITAFEYQGNYLALTALTAFLNEGESETLSSGEEIINKDNVSWKDAKTYIMYTGDFKYIASFVEQVVGEDQKLDYTVIISTGCGIYLIYILLSFSLDMGVRVVKLAFYQMIAPIPIMMRILPSKEGQFTKWVKNVISTYAEVFVRLIVVYVAVFLCSEVLTSLTLKKSGTGLIGKVVIFLGIFTFVKQAPKLLSDMLGFEGGNLSTNLSAKLKEGGAFVGGAAIGSSLQSGIQNGTNAWKNGKDNIANAEGGFNKFKAGVGSAFGGAGSVIAGTGSGLVRGANAGRSAGDIKNMNKSIKDAVQGNAVARDNREAYRAAHGGTFRGAMTGHAQDVLDSSITYATGESPKTLNASEQRMKSVLEEYKSKVSAMEGLWKNEKAYIDADANARNARVQATVAAQAFDAYKTGTSGKIIEEAMKLASANPGKDQNKMWKKAYDTVKASGKYSDNDLNSYLDQMNNIKASYNNMLNTQNNSISAANILTATTADIQNTKAAAIASFGTQLDNIRNNNKEYAQYIGNVGDGSDVKTKAAYTKEINNLNMKQEQAKNK